MNTWRIQSHAGPFRAIFFILLLTASASGTAKASAKAEHLYLLAGTPTNDAPQTYPVTLYTPGPHHALKLVRVIVPAKKGLYGVAYDLEGSVYVAYPHMVPTIVSVIRLRSPSLVDEVGFNAKPLFPVDNFFAASAGQDQTSHALYLAWAARQPSKRWTVTALVSIAGGASAGGARVEENKWSQLTSLRYGGCPGGPTFCQDPEVSVAAGQVLIREGASFVPIHMAPPALARSKASERLQIVAASPRFFIISPEYAPKALASGAFRTTPMFVLDKAKGIWRTVTIPCNTPRSRLLGVWLATIVEDYNPNNRIIGNGGIPAGDNNPGRENERSRATDLLPSVRMAYPAFVGGQLLIPGTLILDNLVEGTRITIQTGQEDSEVLDVRSHSLVLYRVNEEIFEAKIEGDKLSASKLVVKGEDVPEVHWVFWSKIRTEQHSSIHNPSKR